MVNFTNLLLLFSNDLSSVDDVGIPSVRELLLVIVGSIYVQLLPMVSSENYAKNILAQISS